LPLQTPIDAASRAGAGHGWLPLAVRLSLADSAFDETVTG